MDYEIVEDAWPELADASAQAFGGSRVTSGLPVALEIDRGYLFRDNDGRIVHRYPLSQAEGIYYLRHYLRHVAAGVPFFDLALSKSTFLTTVWMALRRLALVRRRVTVLEIGSTIGENYDLLQDQVQRAGLDIEIDFVGIEVSASLTAFARMAHRGDPNFAAIADDGARLDRFPDRAFDLVICNAVAGFVADPKACFAEMARVCRIAMVLAAEISAGESVWRTGARTHNLYFAPSRLELDALWRPHGPFHDYLIASGPFGGLSSDAGGTGYFLGDQADVSRISFERHIVARHPLFSAAAVVSRAVR